MHVMRCDKCGKENERMITFQLEYKDYRDSILNFDLCQDCEKILIQYIKEWK